MSRDGEQKEQKRRLGSRDARGKSIPPIQGCRQEGCSSSAINLACVMAERARCRSSLDEESRAGIISFVHRLPRERSLSLEGLKRQQKHQRRQRQRQRREAVIEEAFTSFSCLCLHSCLHTSNRRIKSPQMNLVRAFSEYLTIARAVIEVHVIERNAEG